MKMMGKSIRQVWVKVMSSMSQNVSSFSKVQVGNDQEKVHPKRNSHSKKQGGTYLYLENILQAEWAAISQ